MTTATLPDIANFKSAQGHPQEDVLVRYTRGRGKFSDDKKFISLSMTMYRPDGSTDGFHDGVWQATFSDPRELLARPAQPTGAFNVPQGPLEAFQPRAQTKGIWSFGDGSAIYAIGDAASHLVPLEDGSFLFMVATAQIITGGTGRYEGAYGLKTSLGSTHIAAGVNLFGPDPVQFEATTIDTFRVMRAPFIKQERLP
jgi:hypothetical protein